MSRRIDQDDSKEADRSNCSQPLPTSRTSTMLSRSNSSPRRRSSVYLSTQSSSSRLPFRMFSACLVTVATMVPLTLLHSFRHLGLPVAPSDLTFLTSCWTPESCVRLSPAHPEPLLSHDSSSGHIRMPLPPRRRSSRPYYAHLDVKSSGREYFGRFIHRNDAPLYHAEKDHQLYLIDQYADEADFSSSDPGRYDHFDDFTYPIPSGCYRPQWTYATHPTCNSFHEMTIDRGLVGDAPFNHHRQDTLVGLVGVGHYRLSWVFGERALNHDFVLKNLRLTDSRNYNHKTMSEIQIEALTMTETTSSPRTINMYGHCGTSVAVERGKMIEKLVRPDREFHDLGEMRLEEPNGIQPRNNFTAEQKLHIAIAMAESLAELHGHPKGPIVNNDVKVDQWLVTRSGLKLNDFNKARIPKWNIDKQEYCPFYSSYETLYRAPEELHGEYVDESPDVYALGKILYTLLTGMQPHFEQKDHDVAIQAIMAGEEPFVDPMYRNSSLIEQRLVDLMEECWAYEPKDRPTIFRVVSSLRETEALHRRNSRAWPTEVQHTTAGATYRWI